MAIAYGANRGTASGQTQITSFNITLNGSIPSGSLILVSVAGINVGDTSDLSSVTDSAGNTYVSGGFAADGGQNCLCAVWYAKNSLALSSSQTVTVTFHAQLLAAGEAWIGSVDYLTGADTSSPKDIGSFSTVAGTVTPWATSSISTTNANDLLWVAFADNQGETSAIVQADCSPTSGWTIPAGVTIGGNGLRTAYQVVSSTGSYKGGGTDNTVNNGMSVGIIGWKAASSGGGTPVSATLGLMGVG